MNAALAPSFVAPASSFNVSAQEIRLRAFIRFSLQKARTSEVSTDLALQLMDRAWEAQKLLWQLQAARAPY
ncbi:MAG: hypothetical protein ACAF41_01170 [Leptolyngbya sp. BL-A-14]